jgi:hypothetical protein
MRLVEEPALFRVAMALPWLILLYCYACAVLFGVAWFRRVFWLRLGLFLFYSVRCWSLHAA